MIYEQKWSWNIGVNVLNKRSFQVIELKEAIVGLARALGRTERDVVEALEYDNLISEECYDALRKWCDDNEGDKA